MKVKVFLVFLCIFIITIIQSTVLNYLQVYSVKPNLLIIFVVLFALLRGNLEGAAVGFFAGLAQDVAAGKLLGFYSLLGLYLGLIVGSLNRRLYRENFFVAVFFTFISTAAYELVVYLMHVWGMYFSNPDSRVAIDLLYVLRNKILPEAIYNSVASIFIYIFVIKLNYRFEDLEKPVRKY